MRVRALVRSAAAAGGPSNAWALFVTFVTFVSFVVKLL
jgi:hypothetical protein